MEEKVLKLTQDMGIGAQFGGKYFCHDVRVVRLPRHGAVASDRDRGVVLGRPPVPGEDHARGRLHRAAGVQPGPVPARHHPPDLVGPDEAKDAREVGSVVKIDLNQPMARSSRR